MSNDWDWMAGFPWGWNALSEDQLQALEDAGYVTNPIPTERSAFDLEEQTDEEWATFLADVEAKANERTDREIEREVEDEARVSELRDSVDEGVEDE